MSINTCMTLLTAVLFVHISKRASFVRIIGNVRLTCAARTNGPKNAHYLQCFQTLISTIIEAAAKAAAASLVISVRYEQTFIAYH